MLKQIILALLATVISANVIGWRDCGSHLGDIHRIVIEGCSQTPCAFRRGETHYIEAEGSSRSNSINLPFAVHTTILGIPITLLEGNVCNYLINGTCPVTNGDRFTYRIYYEVPTNLPPIQAVMTSTVWNDWGDVGICVQLDAVLV